MERRISGLVRGSPAGLDWPVPSSQGGGAEGGGLGVVSARSGRGWQRRRWAMPAASPIAAWGGLGITRAQRVPDAAQQRTTGTWALTRLPPRHDGCGHVQPRGALPTLEARLVLRSSPCPSDS